MNLSMSSKRYCSKLSLRGSNRKRSDNRLEEIDHFWPVVPTDTTRSVNNKSDVQWHTTCKWQRIVRMVLQTIKQFCVLFVIYHWYPECECSIILNLTYQTCFVNSFLTHQIFIKVGFYFILFFACFDRWKGSRSKSQLFCCREYITVTLYNFV